MDAQPLPWFLSLGSSIRGVLAVDLVGLLLTVLAFAADTIAPSGSTCRRGSQAAW